MIMRILNLILEAVAILFVIPCLWFAYEVFAVLLGERKADNTRWDTNIETEQNSRKENLR